MTIPSRQIGQSAESNLLWTISKQLDNIKKFTNITDPVLLAKIDDLIAVTSQVEINAESINLNTDQLELLIEQSNVLLEEIKNNTASGGSSFDGQLTQDGSDVSDTNRLPISVGDTLPLPTEAATSTLQTSGNSSLVNIDKNTVVFYTEDVEEDTSNSTTFVGKQTKDGDWLLQKIVDTIVGTKTTTTIQYASVLNNATKTTYAAAWTDRATLTYSEIKNLL